MPQPTLLPGESKLSSLNAHKSLQFLNNQKALQITAMPERRSNQIALKATKRSKN